MLLSFVMSMFEYIGCKSKVDSSDGIVGECKKCGMLMKMKRGVKSVIAKVFVSDGGKINSVTLLDSVCLVKWFVMSVMIV